MMKRDEAIIYLGGCYNDYYSNVGFIVCSW